MQPSYGASIQNLLHRSPASSFYPLHPAQPGSSSSNNFSPAELSPQSQANQTSQTPNTAQHVQDNTASTPSPKRRRLHLNPPLHAADPSSIVVADMQNESDALQILALASGQEGSRESADQGTRSQSKGPDSKRATQGQLPLVGRRKTAELSDFALIKLGIVDEDEVTRLTEAFFRFHHHLFVSTPFQRS